VAAAAAHQRFPLFDSLRAIAALCVLGAHVSFVSLASSKSAAGPFLAQLTVGVCIFFLISGFLLYRPYFAARYHGRESPRAWDFARRRVLRIVPAYWVALTVLALGPGLVGVFSGDWWAYYGFAQIYRSETGLQGMSQAWSLCVEVTFYAALPVYAVVLERVSRAGGRRRMVRAEIAALALLLVACTAVRAYAHEIDNKVVFLTLPANLDWFALGMGLAVLSVVAAEHGERPAPVRFVASRPGLCWLAAAVTFVLAAFVLGLPEGLYPEFTLAQRLLQHLLFGAIAVLLLLPAVFRDSDGGLPRKVLSWRPLAWVGTISYGVFLYNLAVADELKDRGVDEWVSNGRLPWLGLATLAVTVTLAALSYYLVERPLLRRKPYRRAAS